MKIKINYRRQFLINMYNQLFNDINRHLSLTWQSITTLFSALVIFALAEKNILPIDIATTLIILICGWFIANVIDASYWYNRNLAIIANIEREFLNKSDLRKIHYYFGKHRPQNKMIHLLKLQLFFAACIAFIIFLYHFYTRVFPFIYINMLMFCPSLAAIIVIVYSIYLNNNRKKSYEEFLKNSPGITIDTRNIIYGVGHGFSKKVKSKGENND